MTISWMKELHSNILTPIGINAGDVRHFKAIAVKATQREIFGNRRTAMFLRDDVIDLKRQPCKFTGKLTILASTASSFPNS